MKNSNLGPRLTEEILRREWAEQAICDILDNIAPQDITDEDARNWLTLIRDQVVSRGIYHPPTRQKETQGHV